MDFCLLLYISFLPYFSLPFIAYAWQQFFSSINMNLKLAMPCGWSKKSCVFRNEHTVYLMKRMKMNIIQNGSVLLQPVTSALVILLPYFALKHFKNIFTILSICIVFHLCMNKLYWPFLSYIIYCALSAAISPEPPTWD